MRERIVNGKLHGHLQTRLIGLDEALCGGIPFGAVTEVVGPAGIGKTQVCDCLEFTHILDIVHFLLCNCN